MLCVCGVCDMHSCCVSQCAPSGTRRPYCLLLNGDGTSRIRRYVESGGAYLGICAGGYFGCGYVEFDKGGPLEVLGPRELRFFPGVARGPVYTGFRYEDDQGARAIRVRVEELRGKARILVPPGGSQPLADASNTSTKESGEEASASGRVKEGDEEKGAYVGLTYFNGGCEFLPMDRSSDRPWHADHIEVVATYVDEDGGAADASSNQAVSTPGQVNGASGGTSGQRENDSSPSRVAAASHGGHAAAVRCAVGRGVALLMGIHPEMSIARLVSENCEALGVEDVASACREAEASRRRVFCSLLRMAGIATCKEAAPAH
eukprot:jgi/Mesvir1/3890/Mv19837-RA.2